MRHGSHGQHIGVRPQTPTSAIVVRADRYIDLRTLRCRFRDCDSCLEERRRRHKLLLEGGHCAEFGITYARYPVPREPDKRHLNIKVCMSHQHTTAVFSQQSSQKMKAPHLTCAPPRGRRGGAWEAPHRSPPGLPPTRRGHSCALASTRGERRRRSRRGPPLPPARGAGARMREERLQRQ